MPLSVVSPANIAFVKHWGMKGLVPFSSSLSMNLSHCFTHTTVETIKTDTDQIFFVDQNKTPQHQVTSDSRGRDLVAYNHVQFIKKKFGIMKSVRIHTYNSFPIKAGIASSASGFSALTASLVLWAEQHSFFADKQALGNLILQAGSVSACRSVLPDYCLLSPQSDRIDLQSISSDLDLYDLIPVLASGQKKIGSGDGQSLSKTSPYFYPRIEAANADMQTAKEALTQNNWLVLRQVIERQSRRLHQVVETSKPPFVYIQPIAKQFLRDLAQKIDPQTYAVTFDAGTIPHIITTGKSKKSLIEYIQTRPEVEQLFINQPGQPTTSVQTHLF